MKKLLQLLLVFCVGNFSLEAQCPTPQAQIDLHGNNIQARILNGGDLFTDFNDGKFTPNPVPGAANPSTIFAAGLWMGGIDQGGNLKTAGVDYRGSDGSDYSAGPLDENGLTSASNCANWDKLFRVTGAEIEAFLNALPMTEAQLIAQYPAIAGWPSSGNSTFCDVWGFDLPFTNQSLAPFFDYDSDGIYSPLAGDYPAVAVRGQQFFAPAEIVWCVFNDQNEGRPHTVTHGGTLNMEIQLTAWAFNCPDEPVLNNTIFTSHKIIYRGAEPLDSFHTALWIDFDLGCYLDDFVGCDTARNTIFSYNEDAVDGSPGSSCNGVPTFGNMPPVQTVTFFGSESYATHKLDKFMVYDNMAAGGAPVNEIGYYRLLSGSYVDGSALTYGGSGIGGSIPTDHAFLSDPAEVNGWSMCTSNLPPADLRVVGSQKIGALPAGAITEMNAAWTVHYNAPLPCNLGNAMTEVDQVLAIYENGFHNVCSPVSKAPEYPADSLKLFPNPTTGDATLRYGNVKVQELRIFDATGKLLQSLNELGKNETLLRLGEFPTGIYTLRLLTDQGAVTKRLVVAR